MTTVMVTLAGTKPGRPPIERLLLDVAIRNDDAAARWVLIPSTLPTTTGGVDKLEQLTAGPVAIGRLLGTGGRYAIKLAPGARVTLRKLEVAWWRDASGNVPAFDVQVAPDVTAGSEPLAGWFDKDPAISGAVEVDMETAQHTASHRATDDKEVPLTAAHATTTTVKLAVP